MKDVCQLSIRGLRSAIDSSELSIREISQAFLHRTAETEDRVQAFLKIDSEEVLRQADDVENRLRAGDLAPGLLTGVPVAVKDVIVTNGTETTCGSRILKGYHPPYDATVVRKLKEAGAILFGKTNCDEFAMGSSNENSSYFPTRNPWDLERVPGGSSGGSAACVAAGEVPASLGTDTGGSIRQPAAFCGVVGLKPTYGRVSRYGLVAFASSLDQIGPFGKDVRDVATLLQILAGEDRHDGTSSRRQVGDYVGSLDTEVKGLRVGVTGEWLSSGLDPGIRDSVLSAVEALESLGCTVSEVSLPNSQYAIATYYIIAPAEASSNLARYDGVKYGFRAEDSVDLRSMYARTRTRGFGDEVKRRIMLGTYVLSAGYYDAYYHKAGQVRTLIRQDYENAFEAVDVLVGPTTPTLPFKFGEKMDDPLEMYLSDIYTVTANLAGIPGLSMPSGLSPEGLPIGVQLLAAHFEEEKLLRVAYALEQELGLGRLEPAL
jgi:aspartyl-tRNA(Asn)/glutamyl-tRNA(Gln) amidotransferase subunit A